jgi:inner membrane protein
MDPFSHGILGASCAVAFAARGRPRLAALVGATAAMAPDLDVLIRSAEDPLMMLKYHRHFTHALVFVPVGACIMASLWWLVLRRRVAFAMLYAMCLCGMATHGLLDSLTNYGTHLFWPFTNRRESWSAISIVDPIFTLTLLGFLLVAVVRKRPRLAAYGLCFALAYWSAGLVQRERATQAMLAMAQQRGQVAERFEVKPSLGNIVLWRVQYAFRGQAYVDAVQLAPFAAPRWYEGSRITLLEGDAGLPEGSRQQADLADFRFFSDGWLARVDGDDALIGDVRFAMLPNQLTPLWGIRLTPEAPQQPVQFENIRRRTPGDVLQLWQMLCGEAQP